MPQIINTNIASMNAQRNLNSSQAALQVSLTRLSSGLRINTSKDDAAGLAVASRMETQSRGMSVAMRNASDGLSLAQTAEGGLQLVTQHLQRMRELAVQSANGIYTSADRSLLNAEFTQLASEVSRVIQSTDFNGKKVLNGSAAGIIFQIGANGASSDRITVDISNLSGVSGLAEIPDVSIGGAGATAALSAMTAISTALSQVNRIRANLGAVQSRFDGIVALIQTSKENTEAARSRIMDADYASETANLTRTQILQQAGIAMLSQANALPNNVLSLLR